MTVKVAIIGSFKQHYSEILRDWQTFTDAGMEVRSPKGSRIIEPDIDFVRFQSDDPELSDPQVQQVALHRILGADFVYVEAPDGYVGRTTCYEIGRILMASVPLYFSHVPYDLPLEVPDNHVASASTLVERFQSEAPLLLSKSLAGMSLTLEDALTAGNYLEI